MDSDMRRVTIPRTPDHAGIDTIQVYLLWKCPVCGGPRGEPYPVYSYDGSHRALVDGWENSCGHVDKYSTIMVEEVNP